MYWLTIQGKLILCFQLYHFFLNLSLSTKVRFKFKTATKEDPNSPPPMSTQNLQLHMEQPPLKNKKQKQKNPKKNQAEQLLGLWPSWKVGEAETVSGSTPLPEAVTHLWREQKSWSFSLGCKGFGSHIRHPNFLDLYMREEPPTI